VPESARPHRRAIDRAIETCIDGSIARGPRWPSPVGDDGTPFEFASSLGATPELRMLVESLGSAPSLQTNRATALALLASLVPPHAVKAAHRGAMEQNGIAAHHDDRQQARCPTRAYSCLCGSVWARGRAQP
jgi:hypothetical protein